VITAGVLFYVAMTDFGAPEKSHAHGTGMAWAPRISRPGSRKPSAEE
jgi:hypothetical protein